MRVERARLTDVELHCYVAGEGDTVILAHGFPDEPMTFAGTFHALAEQGYRVVAPTMRGYAPSGEPADGRYDPSALGDDLIGLADHFGASGRVHLVGHDWGAVAAFAAVARQPDRFATLTTLAVPHLGAMMKHLADSEQVSKSWYIGFFQLPVLPERRLRDGDLAFIDELYRDWSPGYTPTDEEMDAVKAAIRPRIPAVLGYYRALLGRTSLLGDVRARMFRQVSVPSTHIHGADDGCIGIACCEGAEAYYAGPYDFVRVEGAGHFVTREKPDAVTRAVLARLRSVDHTP